LKKRTFTYLLLSPPKFENVFLALHPSIFVHGEPQQRANYSCKKIFLRSTHWPLVRVHPLHTDERTDDRRQRCQDAVQHSCCASKTTKSGFGFQDCL